MTTDPGTPAPQPQDGGRAWVRPVVLVVACLIIGFVAGWVFRGDDGQVTVLEPTPAGDSGDAGTVTTPGGTGTATTGGAATAPGGAATAPATPPPPPDRADITLAVLNGTSTTGLAAQTAGEAEALGYPAVSAGNAPTTTGPSVIYYRRGRQAAAERVAKDLQVDQVRALPTSGAVSGAAPDGAEVVLVLGPG